jgi:SMI1 / KNR4 family (SUKH-1)
MEIIYLKKLEETYQNNSKLSRIGVAINEIEKLEKELNISLPKTYKEFLFLAGKRDNILGDWNRGFDDLDWIQDQAKESMENVNLSLKPYFAFAEYGRDQFLFFFLNEGDNPAVYQYAEDKFHKNEKDEYVYYSKFRNSFSEYIEICID